MAQTKHFTDPHPVSARSWIRNRSRSRSQASTMRWTSRSDRVRGNRRCVFSLIVRRHLSPSDPKWARNGRHPPRTPPGFIDDNSSAQSTPVCFAAACRPKVVQKLLGHASVTTTTSTYSHLGIEDIRRVLDKVGWLGTERGAAEIIELTGSGVSQALGTGTQGRHPRQRRHHHPR
ncbi:hypothetical protein [Flindersiella endophytica]